MQKVLVVDDESCYRDSLDRILTREGYHVATASAPKEAVELGVLFRPDILVTDWMLNSNIHGANIARALRAANPELQSILMTGFPSAEVEREIERNGHLHLLTKPFPPEKICEAVASWLAVKDNSVNYPAAALLEADLNHTIIFTNSAAKKLLDTTQVERGAGNLKSLFTDTTVESLSKTTAGPIIAEPLFSSSDKWEIFSRKLDDKDSRILMLYPKKAKTAEHHLLAHLFFGAPFYPTPSQKYDIRALVVSDNPAFRHGIVKELQALGCFCHGALTCLEGYELLKNDPKIMLVILDNDLTFGQGFNPTSQFKTIRPNIQIGVIHSIPDQKRSFEASYDFYLDGPPNSKDLFKLLGYFSPKTPDALSSIAPREDRGESVGKIKEEDAHFNADFIYKLVHELRSPVASILGYAEKLMEKDIDAAKQHSAAQVIITGAEHTLDIISNILDFAKLKAGQFTFRRAPCSVIKILHDVQRLMQPHAAKKNLELDLEFTGLLPNMIESDPLRLRQILLNLVSNAIKYTSAGRIQILVQLLTEDTFNMDSPRLSINVLDSGVGIDSTEQAKIFQPFGQLEAQDLANIPSTGLGLTVTSELVSLLGGSLKVLSLPGTGSIFSILLPIGSLEGVLLVDPWDVDPDLPNPEDEQAEDIKLSGRILLVEDNRVNQRLYQDILTKQGGNVTAVSDGQEALVELSSAMDEGEPYDLVLMDLNLPVLSGIEATRLMRSRGDMTPVIAFSSVLSDEDLEALLSVGCSDCIEKPISRANLLKTVAKHLHNNDS